jgi:hypothetical protein
MAKPIRPYPGGNFPNSQSAVFMMVEPIKGLAPARWQLGPRCNLGMIGFGHRDGKPFTCQQWADLHSYIYDGLMDCYSDEMDSSDIIAERINLNYFNYFVHRLHNLQPGQPLQQQPVPVYMCSKCGKDAPKKCSKCTCTYYCSLDCQVFDSS